MPETSSPDHAPGTPGPRTPEPLVLVVDDNTTTASLVARHLRHHGIDTCCAPDGAGALALARHRRPDLVLLDAHLPDIDGTEVCRAIKADPALAGTLVAFLSAERTEVHHRITGLDNGADDYLTHPVDEAELLAKVRSLLRLRHAELAARDSRDLYRELLDAAPIGIAHIALDGRVVTTNRALAAILGAEPAELAGRLFDVFLHPDERTALRAAFGEIISGARDPRLREIRLLTARGTVAWAALASRLHRAPDGSPSHLIVALEDITARRQAEAALVERDHLLHELYEASHDLIAILASDGRILQANTAFHRALGLEPGALRDTSLEAWLAPAHRLAWHGALGRVAGGAGDEIFRGTLLTSARGSLHAEGSLARRDHPGGSAVRVILHDMTEHRRLEEQLLRNQRLDSIGTLAGGIAHDLNNVLAPVFLSLGLLRNAGSEAERAEYIDSIEQCARRASDLVRQVLLFARGAGTEKVPVDPASTLRDLERMLRETFPKDIEITTSASALQDVDTRWVHANPTQLVQVLLNLCLNARDAMTGGGRLAITARPGSISAAEAGAHPGAIPGPAVVFTVSDTGAGIPASVAGRVFDPFFTTKDVGAGTGLGLPTALGITRSHGGFLGFSSTPGKGTTFSVHLPATPARNGSAPASIAPATARHPGALVLLIDDEPILRTAAETVLRGAGYRVAPAGSGSEGIALATSLGRAIRAVVTDLMMPGLDGYATAAALRPLLPGVPVIAITGRTEPDADPRATAAGIDHVIAKPFEPDELLRLLDTVISAAEPAGISPA